MEIFNRGEGIILQIDRGGGESSIGLELEESSAGCDNLGHRSVRDLSVRSQKVVEGGRLQSGSVLSSRYERSIRAFDLFLITRTFR